MSEPPKCNDDDAVYEQGLALLREGRDDEGIGLLRGISARMPKALGDIAWNYRMRGRREPALASLKQFVEHFPGDVQAWTLMAQIERERNSTETAGQYARNAAAARPTDARTWYLIRQNLLLD